MRLSKEEKEARAKRLKEWQGWLRRFRTHCNNSGNSTRFTYVPDAANMLNDLYWNIAEEYVRPILKNGGKASEKHKIHPYKIIAVSEISVMMTSPVTVKNNEQAEKMMNASLAWFVATQIIETWDTGSAIKVDALHIDTVAFFSENIDTKIKYPIGFAAEHIQWLTMLNVTVEKPLLLLAQCWRLFFISCLAVASKGKLN
jgi:hypothetical protein